MSIFRRRSAAVFSVTAVTALALSTAASAVAAPGVPPSLVESDPTIAQPATRGR